MEAVRRSVLCRVVTLAKELKKKKITHPSLSGKVTKNKQIDAMGSVWKVIAQQLLVAFIALCRRHIHILVKADAVWSTWKNPNIDKLTASRLEKSVTYSNEAGV